MNLRSSKRIEPCPDVLAQEVNGEMVLLDMEAECYFGLNEVATRIWQLLQDGKDLSAILAILETEYEVERTRLESDVNELVGQLIEARLVTTDTS